MSAYGLALTVLYIGVKYPYTRWGWAFTYNYLFQGKISILNFSNVLMTNNIEVTYKRILKI